jgi:hypothetical protein
VRLSERAGLCVCGGPATCFGHSLILTDISDVCDNFAGLPVGNEVKKIRVFECGRNFSHRL